MKLLIIALVCLLVGPSAELQYDIDKLEKKSTEVFQFARQGHEDMKPQKLLEAAKILLKYPIIITKTPETEITAAQTDPPPNYFDVDNLLYYAKKYTPIDDFKQKNRILKVEKRANRRYQRLGNRKKPIENYHRTIMPNQETFVPLRVNDKTLVKVTIQTGGSLKLFLRDKDEKDLKENINNDAVKKLDYYAWKANEYRVYVRNKSNKTTECHVMVKR